mmetsp:Transcript_45092/g.73853  ORF Transcript_45092/g.73853 Transcript_45092/m.73853 type:complete len:88 (-) Transcript_45092:258-521(-)
MNCGQISYWKNGKPEIEYLLSLPERHKAQANQQTARSVAHNTCERSSCILFGGKGHHILMKKETPMCTKSATSLQFMCSISKLKVVG